MLAAKLADLGLSPATVKALIVLLFGGVALLLTNLVTGGYITGVWAVIVPVLVSIITGAAALVDPNASH